MPVQSREVNAVAAHVFTEPAADDVAAVPLCIGFTAVLAQIVLMRELVVIFCGTEVSLGLILATWLLWTAFGGGVLGRLRLFWPSPTLVARLQIAAGFSLPASIMLIRLARLPFHVTPGELIGPGAMLVISLVGLMMFCTLSGWLYAAASRLYACEGATSAADASGTVYFLEAVGSCLGGLIASTVLLRYCTAFQIAVLVLTINLMCAAWVVSGIRLWATAAIAAVSTALVIWGAPRLEVVSQAQLWRGFLVRSSVYSVYGRLDVVDTASTRSIYENGLVAFHAEDPASAEEAVHFALLQHAGPRSLLLIGGGLNGSLGQALQHQSVSRIDYVELDPSMIALAERYFAEQSVALRSPRVRLHNADGRRFIKTTAAHFDVIIVNLPEPQTAQLNRFYTREFFAEAASKLNPGGLLSLQLRGAEDYISPELGEFLRCINNTLRSVFTDVVAIPGDTVHFFAAKKPGILTVNAEMLLARLRQRKIEARYVREYYLPFRLAPDRIRDLERELDSQRGATLNTDLSPAAYYFAIRLWSTHYGERFQRLFSWLAQVRFLALLVAMTIPVLVVAASVRWFVRGARRLKATAGLCAATTGMVLMALEVLLLLGFQAIYGYVYYQLAIVIGAFMAGMATGSWLLLRSGVLSGRGQSRIQPWALAGLQAGAAISPLLLYALLSALTGIASTSALGLSQVSFPAMAMAFGLIGGCQFQAATRVYFPDFVGESTGLAALYALDLLGAFVGAILVSAYLVPVFGIEKSAYLISAVALGPVLAAIPPSASATRLNPA